MLNNLSRAKIKIRLLSSLVLLLALASLNSNSASAASASLSPSTRSVCVGTSASFSGSWGNYAPYEVSYDTGGGTPGRYYNPSTYSTSRGFSAYYGEGSYDTLLEVWDNHSDYANSSGHVNSYYYSGCPQ